MAEPSDKDSRDAAASGAQNSLVEEETGWRPLFQTDFVRFEEISLGRLSAEERAAAYPTGPDALLGEIVRYGVYSDELFIPELQSFYRWCVEQGMPASLRLQIQQHVEGFVEHSSISANAFMPFMIEDPDRGVVSSAAIGFASLHPLPAVQEVIVIGLIRSGKARNSGALFGGLLHLGDRRVNQLLWPIRDELPVEAIHQVVHCTTGIISAATIEFYLDWLESLEGTAAADRLLVFESVAAGVFLERRDTIMDTVLTGGRPFPFNSISPEEVRRMSAPVPLAEYTAQIAPRLHALYRTEPLPKVMGEVLKAWGLPLPDETALQPRILG